MTDSLQLPFDVINEVLSHSSPQTLLSWALVSTLYRPFAERLLYRTVKLYDTVGTLNRMRVMECLSILADVPQKAALVRTLMAFLQWGSFAPGQAEIMLFLLRRALVNMVSLEHLWLQPPNPSKLIESPFS